MLRWLGNCIWENNLCLVSQLEGKVGTKWSVIAVMSILSV